MIPWQLLVDLKLWFTVLILIILEIILGIDNLVFLSVVSLRLPIAKQSLARRLGLLLALVMRLGLLAFALFLINMTSPLFTILGQGMSIRNLFLLIGGLFLVWKAIFEMRVLSVIVERKRVATSQALWQVICQIALLDMVFSIDSIMTAIGVVQSFGLIALAIIVSVVLMLIASEPLSYLVQRYSWMRRLALYFILIIGIVLIIEGVGIQV